LPTQLIESVLSKNSWSFTG